MLRQVQEELRTKGYSLVPVDRLSIGAAIRDHGPALAREWENLEPDEHLKNGARFRERRYDRFRYLPRGNTVRLRPHQPYFQSEEANQYAGGIQRTVAPLTRTTVENPLLQSLFAFDFAQFPVEPALWDEPWDVQCHQFRILSRDGEIGEPTPEGPHRDEIDFGAIHLMSRSNVRGGISQVYSTSNDLLAEVCLASPMDTLYWADNDVLHAVTPVLPEDRDQPAVRDVLILGFRCSPGLPEDE